MCQLVDQWLGRIHGEQLVGEHTPKGLKIVHEFTDAHGVAFRLVRRTSPRFPGRGESMPNLAASAVEDCAQ